MASKRATATSAALLMRRKDEGADFIVICARARQLDRWSAASAIVVRDTRRPGLRSVLSSRHLSEVQHRSGREAMTITNLHREQLHHEQPHRARSRREFLAGAGSFALAAALPGQARAAMGPDDKFDLVIKSADVLDPSQSFRGKRDIGIRYGLIEAVEIDIPAARAVRVLDAGGKLGSPGAVATHCPLA